MGRRQRAQLRVADLRAAVKRGQVHADLFGTLRGVGAVGGVLAVLMGATGVTLGLTIAWVLVPNLLTGRWLVRVAAWALVAAGGASIPAGWALCAHIPDARTLRRRLATAARRLVLLGLPGLQLLGMVVAVGAADAAVGTAGWLAVYAALTPLGLAATLGLGVAAAPAAGATADAATAAEPRRARRHAGWAVPLALALLPEAFRHGPDRWPHRPLPTDSTAAVAAMDDRMAWEQGWRFRAAQAFPWASFVTLPVPVRGVPTLDPPAMSPSEAQAAIDTMAKAAAHDLQGLDLLIGLIRTPTIPVRVRGTAIDACSTAFDVLPADLEAALVDVLRRPNIDPHADLGNWYRMPSGRLPALIAAEDDLRNKAIQVLWHAGAHSPPVLDALRALRDHPRLDVLVRTVLAALEAQAPAPTGR